MYQHSQAVPDEKLIFGFPQSLKKRSTEQIAEHLLLVSSAIIFHN